MPFRVSIDGLLIDQNIFRLRLRDLDLRLQFRRVRHASQVRPRGDTLPDLHRQLLQDTVHAGFHMQLLDLIHF